MYTDLGWEFMVAATKEVIALTGITHKFCLKFTNTVEQYHRTLLEVV